MGGTIVLCGIVLKAAPVGEYDKRLIVLTGERGKITVFVRGARRVNSAFLASTNPFAYGEFELFEGRNSYTACKISIRHYFRELSEDIETASYGFYFLELADYYAVENLEARDLCNLLYLSLKALSRPALSNRLVRRITELRMLVISGEYPNLSVCTCCGRRERLHAFLPTNCGMLCDECSKKMGRVIAISDSTLYTMRFIMSEPLGKLFSFTVTDEVLHCLEEILDFCMKRYTDREFHSLSLLDTFC